MALEKFNFESIPSMDDGRIGKAFDSILRRCIEDCRDRAADKRARKVTLTVQLNPESDDQGNLVGVDVAFDIGEAIPKLKSAEYSMRASRAGPFFNELSPDDSNQLTLDGLKPRRVSDPDDEGDEESSEAANH